MSHLHVGSRALIQVIGFGMIIVLAWFGAQFSPSILALLLPVTFGVLHIGSDIRYLFLKNMKLYSRSLLLTVTGLVFLWLILRALPFFGQPLDLRFELFCGLGIAIAPAIIQGNMGKTATPIVIGGAILGTIAWRNPAGFLFSVAYAHNVIAIGIAFWLLKQKGHYLPILIFSVLFVAGMGLSLLDILPFAGDLSAAVGNEFGSVALFSSRYRERMLVTFLFAQIVHLTVWVFLVPMYLESESSLKLRMIRWKTDWTPIGAAVLTFIAISVLVFGFFDLAEAKYTYISFSGFHAWIELCGFSLIWTSNRQTVL